MSLFPDRHNEQPFFVESNHSEGIRSRLSHYFGRGCQLRDRCYDQILITLPSYAALAYSIGATLARKMESKRTIMEA